MEIESRDLVFGISGICIMWFMDLIILRPRDIIPNGWVFAISGAIGGIIISKIYTKFAAHAKPEGGSKDGSN